MKFAFTMIEVVMVIIIVGILAFAFRPNFGRDGLLEACNQIVRDIRYTQNLALKDHKFNDSDEFWYSKRPQFMFFTSSGDLAYVIFSDKSGEGNPDQSSNRSEIYKNPLDTSKHLIGASRSSATQANITDTLNIKKTFGISSVDFSDSCSTYNSTRLMFDRVGRPFLGSSKTPKYSGGSLAKPYQKNRFITSTCIITLTHQDGRSKNIYIEPETGYVHLGSL